MPLTVKNIYQWMDENRPYNLSEDLEQLWDDDSILNTILISRAYIGYVIEIAAEHLLKMTDLMLIYYLMLLEK